MHPATKESVRCIDVGGGVYVRSGSNGFLLRGKGFFEPVSKLIALLDGGHSVEWIKETLPIRARPLFRELYEGLDRNNMLTAGMLSDTLEGTGSDATRAYLRESTSYWREAFSAFSNSHLVIAGTESCVRLTSNNLVEMGARRITAAAVSGDPFFATGGPVLEKNQRPGDRQQYVESVPLEALLKGGLPPNSFFVYLCADDLAFWAVRRFVEMVIDPASTLFGAWFGDLGLVSPYTGPQVWPELVKRTLGHGKQGGVLCTKVLSSMVAFEVLQRFIDRSIRDERPGALGPGKIRLIRSNGTNSVHDLGTAMASPGPATQVEVPVQPPVRAIDDHMMPWFDAQFGWLSWIDPIGNQFPLVVRGVRIGHENGPKASGYPTHVFNWGFEPRTAERRAFGTALATLEAARQGIRPSDVRSPVFAEDSEDAVRASAASYLLAMQGVEPKKASSLRLDGFANPKLRMLVRLGSLYGRQDPGLWAASDQEEGPYVVWADHDGTWTCAINASLEAGAIEALGDAIAQRQTGQVMTRQSDPAIGRLVTQFRHGEEAPHSDPACRREIAFRQVIPQTGTSSSLSFGFAEFVSSFRD